MILDIYWINRSDNYDGDGTNCRTDNVLSDEPHATQSIRKTNTKLKSATFGSKPAAKRQPKDDKEQPAISDEQKLSKPPETASLDGSKVNGIDEQITNVEHLDDTRGTMENGTMGNDDAKNIGVLDEKEVME